MFYMLKENIANAFLAETTKNLPVGGQDLFMTHCHEEDTHHGEMWKVVEMTSDGIWACVR